MKCPGCFLFDFGMSMMLVSFHIWTSNVLSCIFVACSLLMCRMMEVLNSFLKV